MAVQRISLVVMRGEQFVERLTRPLRRTPDGRVGAEYLGLVYPLDGEGRIDLDGAWHYPAEAPILLDPPADIPSNLSPHWLFEQEGRRTYIFLNGGEEILAAAVRRLQDAGQAAEHWGRSFRRGANGYLFDWFIRIGAAGEETSPTEGQIAHCLAGLRLEPSPVGLRFDGGGGLGAMALEQQLISVEQQLAQEVRARDAAEAANEELRRAFRAELDRTHATAAFLRATLDHLGQGVAVDREKSAAEGPDVQALRQALAVAKSEVEAALADLIAADERRNAEALEKAELRARVAELEAALAERPAGQPRSRRGRGWLHEAESTLRVFTPTIRLVRESANFIATEVADPTDLYRKLAQLETDRTSLKAWKVQAADGWSELHFSTGLDNDGRLYFRKGERGAHAWDVLVSDKAAQPRDFDWIRNQ